MGWAQARHGGQCHARCAVGRGARHGQSVDGGVGLRIRRDGGERIGAGHGGVGQALQLAEAGKPRAVVGRGGHQLQENSHRRVAQTAQAQLRQIGSAQHRASGAARSGGQQAVDRGGQGVEFSHAVHAGGGLCTQAVVEQGQTGGVARNGPQAHTNGLVVGHSGVVGRAVGGNAIGFGQDAVVGIDQGLHLGRGVGQRAGDGGAGQRALNGGQVGAVHAGHARLGKGGGGRCCAAIVLCVAADGAQRCGVGVGGGGDDRLQVAQAVHLAGAGCSNGLLHHGQVGGGDAAHAQRSQIGQARGVAQAVAAGGADDAADLCGQCGQLGVGVHRGRGQAADDGVEQAGFFCTDGGQAQCDELGLAQAGGGGAVAVGCGQQGVEGIRDTLHQRRGVGAGGGQLRHEGVQVGQLGAGDTVDFGVQIVLQLRGGVAAGVGADHAQCIVVGGRCGIDDGLQFDHRVHTRAIVGGGFDAFQNGRQIQVVDVVQAQGRKARHGQWRGRCAAQGREHEVAHGVGQGGQIGIAADLCAGATVQHVIEQAGFRRGVHGAQAQGAELRAGERHVVVAAIAVQAVAQGVDGIDQGLDFGGGVHIHTDQCGTGQRLLDEGQVGAVHAAHVGLCEGAQHRQGAGVALCVIADYGQCRGVGVQACGHGGGQIGHAVDGRVAGAAVGNRRPDVGQGFGGGLAHAQQCQVLQRQGLRGTGQAVDGGGQGVKVCDRVDIGHGFVANDVVEQGQGIGVGGDAAQVHAQGLVSCGRGVAAGGIGQSAIGLGQHQGVGIDHGLYFGRGVDQCAGDGRAGQRAVDSGQQHGVGRAIGQAQARHACGGVGGQVGGSAGVGVGVGADGGQRCAIGRDAGGDHGLQAAQAGDAAAVVGGGGDGSQDRGQVFGRDGAGAQQSVELGCGQSGRGCATGGHHQQAVDCVGQGVEVRDRVHISRTALADQVVEQAQAVGVGRNGAQGNAHRLVGGDRRIDTRSRIRSAAIGLGQDGGVGINDGLHFGGGVHQSSGDGGAGQSRVYGGQQRGVALQAGDACGGVDRFGRGRAGVAVGVADQRVQGVGLRVDRSGHQGLQGVE